MVSQRVILNTQTSKLVFAFYILFRFLQTHYYKFSILCYSLYLVILQNESWLLFKFLMFNFPLVLCLHHLFTTKWFVNILLDFWLLIIHQILYCFQFIKLICVGRLRNSCWFLLRSFATIHWFIFLFIRTEPLLFCFLCFSWRSAIIYLGFCNKRTIFK